ncbi:hypothetical protein KDA_20100 [Dictyobacter alpinus]|uniref:FHA domain-containing protein n=1 Tax=Dictyobacter alpinus TaxID=2014873 RepID=A0A402B5B0_9CHLR|nr:FAD-dependent oxidoreductase [Dictyobacter alpinus]GCE26526.1 hypothetical protein KDA_20100 [Dictyobacter alpinus]
MADQISFLIIGNGIAGLTAAETLRKEAPQASIGVIASDAQTAYFRPALKDYLAGRVAEEKLWARPIRYYQSQRIHFLPERVVNIQTAQKVVQLQSGGQVKYDKLLLASGAQAAHLRCPGTDLAGVFTLRTIEDYQGVLERLPNARRVVVCGSGTLALETVETLRHRGIQITHLIRKRTLWSEVLDATASDLVIQEERRAGIDVQLETEIEEIVGSRGTVSAVKTNAGERIACDLVLIAIGIEPNVDYIRASGIACRRGILVDEYMRTNAPDVYAAGDAVETQVATTGRGRVIGQWYPAIQQARAAAYSMLDILDTSRSFHAETFYNATFLYGLPFASVGATNAKGYRQIVADPKPRSYRKVLLCDGIPVGMLALGDRKHTLAFKRAIDHQVNLETVASRLLQEDFDLAAYLDQQGVPPLLLGVQRVGEAGASGNIAVSDQRSVEGSMLDELSASKHTEALLVHVADPRTPLHIAETPLSRDQSLTVGRQPGVNLVINEGSISRQHALLTYRDGQYVIRDLESLNGTFLNERRLEAGREYPLAINDTLRFGNVVSFNFFLRPLDFNNLTSTPTKSSNPARSNPAGRELDENLLPAGAARPLPPAVINALKVTPALIVLPAGIKGARKQPPQVHLLQDVTPVTIGRDASNDITLNDMVVSRRHAQVFPAPDGFYIQDLGSSNGIVVNQARIQETCRLSHGDHITMGSTLIFFVDVQSGQEKTSKLQSLKVASPPAPARNGNGNGRANNPMFVQPPQTGTETRVQVPAMPSSGQTRSGKQPPKVITCPKCGVVNMPIARFCAGCSSVLSIS